MLGLIIYNIYEGENSKNYVRVEPCVRQRDLSRRHETPYYGCGSPSMFKLFVPIVLVFVVVIAILIAKELVYDEKMAQGTPEPRDLLWGIVGLVLGLL